MIQYLPVGGVKPDVYCDVATDLAQDYPLGLFDWRKIMGKEITKLINRALTWDGYLEKKSNRDLDDFTANAGNKNYTCFARDYK